ncbi:MAG: lipopolysaccharide biosynthesis protein [Bacteroidetes bacterium]|nr:lipopolysaccharide biosynthesis protein [Bacteroidota bacterium]
MENLKKKSIHGFFWSFTGKLASQTVGFIVSIFLARLLSPEDFGLIAMVTVVIAISSSFVDLGLGLALIQRKEVEDRHYSSVFIFNLTIGTFFAVVLFLGSGLLARFYDREIIGLLAKALSPLFIINSFGSVIRMKLQKELNFKVLSSGNFIGAIISGIIGITLAFQGYGIWSLVLQSMLNPLVSNLYLFYKIKWRPKLQYSYQAIKELLQFGIRVFGANMLEVVYTNIDNIIIGKIFKANALGYYFRAKSFNSYVIQYTSGSLMMVFFPVFSHLQHDKERLKTVVYQVFHMLNLITFFMVGLLYVTSSDLIVILFSSKWIPSVIYFKIMLFGGYGYPLSSLLINIISGVGNSKDYLRLAIYQKILLSVILVVGFFYGIEGYLYGLAIGAVIGTLINIYFVAKQLSEKMFYYIRIILPYFILTAILMFGLEYVLKQLSPANLYLHFVLAATLFSCLFILIVWKARYKGFQYLVIEVKKLNIRQRLFK